MAHENGSVTEVEPEVVGKKTREREKRGGEKRKKKKSPARTSNDASLWPFGSLMVVRHASLCVPSLPCPSTGLSLSTRLSIPPPPAHPTRCTLRTPRIEIPTIPAREPRFDAERGCSRVEISDNHDDLLSGLASFRLLGPSTRNYAREASEGDQFPFFFLDPYLEDRIFRVEEVGSGVGSFRG